MSKINQISITKQAQYLHQNYVAQLFKQGYEYGEEYDPKELTSPMLQHWDGLPQIHKDHFIKEAEDQRAQAEIIQ